MNGSPTTASECADIGTTKKGIRRIAASAASRADAILRLHGVRSFHVRIITCKSRSGVATWHKLERALLLTFREMYGDIPKCNSQGHKTKPKDEFDYFRRDRLRRILQELE